MAEACPRCGYCPGDDALQARVEELRSWCAVRGHWIGPGDTVIEDVAAALLKRSPNTLRGWRSTDQRLPYERVGNRIRYRLADIAAFMAAER